MVPRQPQVPVAVKDAGRGPAPQLEGVSSRSPCQIVCETPAILRKPLNLAAFERTAQVEAQTATGLIINDDTGGSVSPVTCEEHIKMPVVRKTYFVDQARVENMGLIHRYVMKVIVGGAIDGPFCCERAATKLIHEGLSVYVYSRTDPVT